MSAFFKPKGTKQSYFSISNQESSTSSSGWAIEIKQPEAISNAKGEPLDSLQVSANQRVVLDLGDIQNPRYHLLVKYNPELFLYGTVQIESMREPGESGPLLLHFKADRQVDLGSLAWIARLYLAD
jgi:hypothetical protein